MAKTILILVAVLFCGCANGVGYLSRNSSAGTIVPTLARTDFMTGLQNPWDMAFTSDGTLFFTEKCRGLSVRKTDGSVTRLFGTTGSAVTAPDLFCEGQSGVLGVALDPQFTANRFIYVYMSSTRSSPKTNRVLRFKVDPQLSTVSERTDIITDIPYKNNANAWGGAGSHSGGRIRFGPDGFLYVTTGDNHNGPLPQDLTKLGGKVLRVDRNGAAAPGNNTPAGGDARIFTYGHRNVQGLAFHPRSNKVYICEHGPSHSDEITVLRAGGNGGWDPKPDPGVSCADNYCGYISNNAEGTPTSMTDLRKFPEALRPLVVYSDSKGMGPCTFFNGPQWQAWNGSLAVSLMAEQHMDIILLSGNEEHTGTARADLPAARLRSLVQGPDGNLYIATDGGQIWKVTPE